MKLRNVPTHLTAGIDGIMTLPLEVHMTPDSSSHLSPEQEFARKLAARELAKYCQEFSRWRKSKGGHSHLGKISTPPGYAANASLKKPAPRVPHSSA
jgi:hypothetical protein